MANKATNTLQVTFQQVAGVQQMDTTALVSQLDALRSVSETQVDALGSNTQAVTENTSSRSASGVAQSVASTLGKTALSMMPLVGIFSQLFGGGDQPQTQATPVKYTPPPAINIDGTTAFSSAAPQSAPTAAVVPTPAPAASQPASAPAVSAAPQVTIQVQAMDSRSFMDHSQEIAQAVREAMLNMSPLNDVVSDL